MNMNMVAVNTCFHLFQVNTWEMNSWTVEGVLFLTAHKTSPVSKAVVPIYISLSMRAPLFQIHPYLIPPVISLSKQSQYVVLIYLCVCMQAQACPSTHVRGHLAGAGSPPCSPGIEFSFIRLGGKLF